MQMLLLLSIFKQRKQKKKKRNAIAKKAIESGKMVEMKAISAMRKGRRNREEMDVMLTIDDM